MTVRLKYAQNAIDGNGTLFRGELAHVDLPDLLGGNSGHRIWEVNTTQKYTLGARVVYPDGRVFRYAKAGGTLIPGQGCHSYQQQYIRYAVLAAAAAAGATQLSVTVNADDGEVDTNDGALATNELQGGYCVIFDKSATNMVVLRKIIANTAVASGGGTTVITIDDPIPNALTTTDAIECMASPYFDVRNDSSDQRAIVGVPTMVAAANEYLWIQTWGVCWVAPHDTVGTGANVHTAVFNHDGSLGLHADGAELQHAGFVLQRGRSNAQGAPFIMLQISI